jgi:predicted MFS family arabinose efflux permease
MKKIVSIMVLLTIMADICGQEAVNSYPNKDFYLQISKKQNTTGWVLLLSGTAMAVGGAMAFNRSWDEGSATSTDIFGVVLLAGVIADLVSIPFFISAGVNKRMAARLSFNLQDYPPGLYSAGSFSPAVSMRLSIHR